MKRFAMSYWLVKWLWYRVYDQKVVISSPHMFFLYVYLYSIRLTSFIKDVPRPMSNFLLIIYSKRLMRNAYTEPGCLGHLRASK